MHRNVVHYDTHVVMGVLGKAEPMWGALRNRKRRKWQLRWRRAWLGRVTSPGSTQGQATHIKPAQLPRRATTQLAARTSHLSLHVCFSALLAQPGSHAARWFYIDTHDNTATMTAWNVSFAAFPCFWLCFAMLYCFLATTCVSRQTACKRDRRKALDAAQKTPNVRLTDIRPPYRSLG